MPVTVTPTPLPILPNTFEPEVYNTNFILYWNNVCNDLIRLTVTLGGPSADPPGGSRALALLHIAINDSFFAIHPDALPHASTYLTSNNSNIALRLPPLNNADDARQAVAGTAITVLTTIFGAPNTNFNVATTTALAGFVQQRATEFQGLNIQSSSYQFGCSVANVILKYLNDPSTFAQNNFSPPGAGTQYRFADDPTNPIRIVPVDPNNPIGPTKFIHFYDAPYYGKTAKRIAIQDDTHVIGDPPVGAGVHDQVEYDSAFKEVYRYGGATTLNTTKRSPKQQEIGFFWAYDGTNLLGTPPRHYSKILRKIAWEHKPAGPTDRATNAEFARLFALAMAAMGDAGVMSWEEKYRYNFWRPLSGVRQDNANPLQDPFWLALAAPETNSNQIPFKPPFPSYPSGHATFGGAFFQIIRLYYKRRDNLTFADDAADSFSFSARSDELNGISRDNLRQKYDPALPIEDQIGIVRTDVGEVNFKSCWEAMFYNGLSRVFLGVHWSFDTFASKDVRAKTSADGTVEYKDPKDIKYDTLGPRTGRPGQFPIGGVPLGIGIANDIFRSNLRPTPAELQPPYTGAGGNSPLLEEVPGMNGGLDVGYPKDEKIMAVDLSQKVVA